MTKIYSLKLIKYCLMKINNWKLEKSNIPFVMLGFGMLIIHLLLPVPTGDDIHFSSVPDGIFDFLYFKSRYVNWSSRIFLDFLVVTILHLPYIVWRIVNTVIFVLLGVSISNMFVRKNKLILNWFIVFLLLIYPYREISDAGWVTTTMIYLWPLTSGLIAMTIIRKLLINLKVSRNEYILASVLLVYSTNFEILSVILLTIFLILVIYQLKQRKINWYIFSCFVLCICSTIFSIGSPGTIQRRNVELRWFVDFDKISLIEKLEIGLSSTFSHYIFDFSLLFLILSILIFISIRIKYEDFLIRIFSTIPLFMTLFWGVILTFLSPFLPNLSSLDPEITKYGFITLNNYSENGNYLVLIILYVTAYLIPMLIFLVFGNIRKSIIPVGIILLGFISRIVLSFSPTIWASGKRTFFFLSVSIIICSVILIENLLNSVSEKFIENFVFAVGVVALLSYLNLVISL